ncbi:lysoplasmalogenase [Winogradskyella sp. DF17]|uniref:Lysoplasmalogenase n=1 Tax=Winogradskyella pelagia TaxID=2819984 RepID=A0ABS3T403_9FLAO|nr:lysoplasmalogenase [Winogradskyella sp. DF17]MBO3116606.1 lysoplasmalogenase [Winogradskyella sp. DF17]
MDKLSFTSSEKQFSILYVIIVLIELISGSLSHLTYFHFIAKPAIVGSLIVAFVTFSTDLKRVTKNLILAGLIFSILGDVILMIVNDWAHAFTSGLIAFLTAHLFYCRAFWLQRDKAKSALPIIVSFLTYGFAIFFFLKDDLGEMMIPVIVYMLVIITMATLAYLRKKSTTAFTHWLVFGGALLFVISDSLLAIDKFSKPLSFSHISIMITYAFAQYGIVFGILKSKV